MIREAFGVRDKQACGYGKLLRWFFVKAVQGIWAVDVFDCDNNGLTHKSLVGPGPGSTRCIADNWLLSVRS